MRRDLLLCKARGTKTHIVRVRDNGANQFETYCGWRSGDIGFKFWCGRLEREDACKHCQRKLKEAIGD